MHRTIRSATELETSPIYVFRVGHLGDSLVALPALKALNKVMPDRPLVLITNQVTRDEFVPSWEIYKLSRIFSRAFQYVPRNKNLVSNLLELASMARQLRREKGRTLLYFVENGRSGRSLFLDCLFFEKICGLEIIGMERASRRKFERDDAGHIIPELPEYQRLMNIVVDHFDADRDVSLSELLPRDLDLCEQVDSYWNLVPSDAPKVALAPGSKRSSRQWPLDRFAAVGQHLIDQQMWPIIFGAQHENRLARWLMDQWHGIGSNFCGLPIAEATEALRRCVIYVGNDTGVMHLAATVGVSCVAIFSACDPPEKWRPIGERHVLLRRRVACEGCMLTACDKKVQQCLESITVPDVIEAIDLLLQRRA